jgi:hypothetical protein
MKPSAAFPLLVLSLSLTACNCGDPRLVDAECLEEETGVLGSCPCEQGAIRPCGSSVGACVQGAWACGPDGRWAEACEGELGPSEEQCDGADNDCDGETDEGSVCLVPEVSCPAAQMALVGRPITLFASASTEGPPIAHVAWTVVDRPPGSSAAPSPATAATTVFEADAPGAWSLSFCATDTAGARSCCEAEVAVDLPCTTPPSPPVSTACETSWDGRPIVQFAPVPPGLFYELVLGAEVLATATAGHNHARPQERIAPGAEEPGTVIQLGVRACRAEDPLCCSSESTATVRVVSECTAPVPASATNLILSEYVVNGEGACSGSNCNCQNGEAIELTNLGRCPVSLDGFHFAYRNDNATPASYRWMNFGAADLVPPRGVYVAMRNRGLATTCAASLGTPRAALYGLTLSALEMQGDNLCSGWFKNSGGGQSELRVAPGAVSSGASLDFTPAQALTRIAPYLSGTGTCESTGFDAIDSCGNVVGGQTPAAALSPNQLGRLWHPCDAVPEAVPACARD